MPEPPDEGSTGLPGPGLTRRLPSAPLAFWVILGVMLTHVHLGLVPMASPAPPHRSPPGQLPGRGGGGPGWEEWVPYLSRYMPLAGEQ